jgi:type IV secretory pathway protease TraF
LKWKKAANQQSFYFQATFTKAMPRYDGHPNRLLQRLIAVTALSLIVLVAIRLSFIQGIFRRITIDGPSMAPRLRGTRLDVTCADCQFLFPCDADHLPANQLAACPNCGYTKNSLDQARLRPADRVLIDRWPLLWRAPQRGSVVAISQPDEDGLAVKRIAALPSERLAIQSGDLFVNGRILRKTAKEWNSSRQLVHDNTRLPPPLGDGRGEGSITTARLPPRWRPTSENSSWEPIPTGFRAAPSSNDDTIDWIHYENWKCTADPRSRGVASPVVDNDSYNQGETGRPLNFVTDVMLNCRLSVIGQGQFILAATAKDLRFEVTIESKNRVTLRAGSRVLATKRLRTDLSRRAIELDFGLCDQQILLVIDGREVLRHPYEPSTNSVAEPLHPLALGTKGLTVEFQQPRVWRDIYYLDPHRLSRHWELPAPLAAHEYALLGDNQPVSVDSRHWQPAGIPLSAILGHVYPPFWASPKKF